MEVLEMQIGYEFKRSSSNKKSNGKPMKMLIAQEMLKETDYKKPAGVVAKLMGLDVLPVQQPSSTVQRNQPNGYSQIPQPVIELSYQQKENGFLDKQMQCEVHLFQEQKDYKDVYKVRQKFPKTSDIKQKSPQKERCTENPNGTKMDLVRQKFIEAKHLATDEKLRHSKEFQEALEVLSSNKDLFLKLLQEPNTRTSQHLFELESIPPSQMKHITVLRPSKMMKNNRIVEIEKKSEKQMQGHNRVVDINGWDRNKPGLNPAFTNEKDDNSTQPTQIVVLKPSPGNTHGVKAIVSPSSLSPRLLQSKVFCEQSEDDEAQCSREVAKAITQQMHANLGSHQREETMLSSLFSKGYFGDNRSKNECMGEGNISDSEFMTPTSRHSQDYISRFGSPCSSSFSGASYYPESSVCREAKKRLSERWVLMMSNRNDQEQRQIRRSSSTLGEMLAFSDTKKSARSGEGEIEGASVFSSRSCDGEQNLRDTTLCLSVSHDNDASVEDFSRNLLHSRSVPVSSISYGTRLNVDFPEPEVCKSSVPKEVEKPKCGKLSLKGKVASLFFSRNKKPNKEKSNTSPFMPSQENFQSAIAELPGVPEQPSSEKTSDDIPECVTTNGCEAGQLLSARRSSSSTSSPASTSVEPKQDMFGHEAVSSLAKLELPGNRFENQDLPSPLSVLKVPFRDDATPQPSESAKSDLQGSLMSNLIAKSPPIESLARSLSWDDAFSKISKPNPLDSSIAQLEGNEEQEWLLFIQTLLSSLAPDIEDNSDAVFGKWHLLDNPLDPLLMDKFFNPKDNKEKWHEAKHWQRRSNQKLMFDCVIAALLDITGYGSNAGLWTSVGCRVTVEEVWRRVREWFHSEGRCFSGESGDNNSLVVERVAKNEVVGGGWMEGMRLEVDGVGKEIEGKMMEELVEDALLEFTGRLF